MQEEENKTIENKPSLIELETGSMKDLPSPEELIEQMKKEKRDNDQKLKEQLEGIIDAPAKERSWIIEGSKKSMEDLDDAIKADLQTKASENVINIEDLPPDSKYHQEIKESLEEVAKVLDENAKKVEEPQLRIFDSTSPKRLTEEGETYEEYKYRRRLLRDGLDARLKGAFLFVASTPNHIKGVSFEKSKIPKNKLYGAEVNARETLKKLTGLPYKQQNTETNDKDNKNTNE